MPENYLEEEFYRRVREGDEILEFLQAGSLGGLWYWDLENREQEWLSPKLKEFFGYEDNEVPNTSTWRRENIFEEDLLDALEAFQRHLDEGAPYDQVVRYRHKNGSTVWVRCRGLAIRDETGTPIRMLGVHTDVTELMRAREALQKSNDTLAKRIEERTAELEEACQSLHESERLMQTIVDNMREGVVVVDADGRLLAFNPAGEQILGVGVEDDPVGAWPDVLGIYRPDGVTRCAADELPLARALTGEDVSDVELFVRNEVIPGGRCVNANARPLCDADDNIIGALVVFVDVTERKLREGEIRRLNEELEIRVARRTAQLEAANKELEAFTDSASHDLRAPLRHLTGFVDLMKSNEAGALSERGLRYLDIISSSAEQMNQLIDGLLEFSETGRSKLRKQPVVEGATSYFSVPGRRSGRKEP